MRIKTLSDTSMLNIPARHLVAGGALLALVSAIMGCGVSTEPTASSDAIECQSDADCDTGSACHITAAGEFPVGTCVAPQESAQAGGDCGMWAGVAAAYRHDVATTVSTVETTWGTRALDQGALEWQAFAQIRGGASRELFGPLMFGVVASDVPSVDARWGSRAVLTPTLQTITHGGGGSNLFAPPSTTPFLTGGDWLQSGGGSNTYFAVHLDSMSGLNGSNAIFDGVVEQWNGGVWLMHKSKVTTMREFSGTIDGVTRYEPPRGVILESELGTIDSPTQILICNSDVATLNMGAGGESTVVLVNSTVGVLSGGAGTVTSIGSTITTNTSTATVTSP